jgi:protein SCO1/2
MIAEGDPVAVELFKKYKQVNMPNLRLVDADIKTLIDFLDTQTAAAKSPASWGKAGDVIAHGPGR